MLQLQEDLLEIYNSLVLFNDYIMKTDNPEPIKVTYEKDTRLLVMELKGLSVRLYLPVYYCLGLEDLIGIHTYLLPKDYDSLMYNLQKLINSGNLIEGRVLVSPEDYGFDIYKVDLKELWRGPEIIGRVRFISGISWIFRKWVSLKSK